MINVETGELIACGLAYIVLHFITYVVTLRKRTLFQSERGIFNFHLVSAICFLAAMISVAAVMGFSENASTVTGLIAVHGIYSVSFLELWSLSQGSYSIAILCAIEPEPILSRVELTERLSRIGNTKTDDRLAALSNVGLVHREGNYWQVTRPARVLALLLRGLLWLPHTKTSG